jgi:UDP-glucose:(heptosyl)LPS alpha-1,3-glucosyltransferase
MQIAFCLYKYFPFGGLQRDFLRIALACQVRGHAIRVYVLEWDGEVPDGFDVVVVPVKALSNARRYAKYTEWVGQDMKRRPPDRVIGFNKMPGLDVYFAADPCYEEKARTLRNPLYRFSARYRHFSAYERAVFSTGSRTEILMISSLQQPFFEKHYATPAERFHLLPPGISPDRRVPANASALRSELRKEFDLAPDDLLLLQVGSGFKTKGLDRSLSALASLPAAMKSRTRLIAIGQDDPANFQRLAGSLGVADRVSILQGRSDIPRFLLGADLLIHPAYNENTGTVLLEALVAGLPVLASAVCGYAHYIEEANGGRVIPEPFAQAQFDTMLAEMLGDREARVHWQANALAFAETADIYSNAERAADLILRDRQ